MNAKQNEIEVELNLTETTTEDLKWNKFREQLFRPLDEPEFPVPTFITSRDKETGKLKTREISETRGTADDSYYLNSRIKI